jgi:Xaa-Pro aminopeptidase
MKYEPIDANLFIANRAKFSQLLAPNSIAIFASNDIYPSSGDGTLPFKQSSDLFYLSGIDQEESILLIFPDAPLAQQREILFLKETNAHIARWEGEKLNVEQAHKISGIDNILWLQDFENTLKNLALQADYIYLNQNEHLRNSSLTQTREDRLMMYCKEKFPLHQYKRSAPILHRIRAIKETQEIELLQKAIDITEKALRRILPFIKDGVFEYEIEAEIIHEFIRNKANGFAYNPILGSGKNSCILHYIENNQVCKNGDIILMDFGANYANYNADLTRSVPVNGRFTARQKQVYAAVLTVKKEAEKLLTPGVFLKDYQSKVGLIMQEQLLNLGLLIAQEIRENPLAYKKYFMHGTSHFLGLDVHDVGLWNLPITENMVFTVEPGIYIPEESLGIRLEDNILIKKTGNINLMRNIPIEMIDIEELMA